MERMKASDFPPEVLKIFDGYVHGAHLAPAVSRRREEVRRRRLHRGGHARGAASQLRVGAASRERRQPHQDRVRDVSVAAGQRDDEGLPRAARQRGRQASGDRGDPREPRPQSVYRGRHAKAGRRRLCRVRAGRPDAARRIPGQRGQGRARCSSSSTRPSAPRTSRRGRLREEPSRRQRQDRRRRFLLRRQHRQRVRHALPDLKAAVPFYGVTPSAEDNGEDQGAAPRSSRVQRRAHQRGLARLRGRAQG